MSDRMVLLQDRYREHTTLFEAFGEVLTEPFFILDDAEQVIGCNEAALQAAGADSLQQLREKAEGKVSPLFVKEKGFFVPDRDAWMGPLGEGNPTIALKKSGGDNHPFRLRVQPLILGGDKIFLMHLNDVDAVHRAKKAQHYFETFKQQFLTNISK